MKNLLNKQIYNMSEIARRLKVTPQCISQIISGKRDSPKMRERILALIKEQNKRAA